MNKKAIILCTSLVTALTFAVTAIFIKSRPLAVKGQTETFSFTLNADNAPATYGEGVDVVATGLGNAIEFNYVGASASSGNHMALAAGGYIQNVDKIKDLTSITVTGNGSFKLHTGFEGYTNVKSFTLSGGTHNSYAKEANIIWMHNGSMMANTGGVDWVWGDCWNFQNHQMGFDENGVDVTVQKAGGTFTLTVNGISGTISFRDFPTAMTNAVGGYCNASGGHINAEFSNLEFDPNNEWYAYNVGGSNPTLTVNPSGSLSVGNCGWKNGFVVQDFTGSSYTLSTHVAGTISGDVTDSAYYGFLAWYKDANNYLIGYIAFESWDRAYEVRELQMTGQINGTDAGWVGDIWCNNSATHPNGGFDLTIAASITGSGATFNVSMSCGASFTKAGTWNVAGATSPTNRVGVFCNGDSALFSSFSIN